VTEHALPFRLIAPDEAEARRKDPTWHRCHTFGEGWGWRRGDGAHVFCRQCPNFEDLPEPEKEAVWQKVKARLDAEREERRKNPVEIAPFTELALPAIRAAFPTNPINDLVSVEPMTGPKA